MSLNDALESMGKIGAELIKKMLRDPSPSRGLSMPCPAYPYTLMADDDGLTHWAGAHGAGVATACGKEKPDVSIGQIKPGRAPTCLWCSAVARIR